MKEAFYADVEALIRQLRSRGCEDWAAALEDAQIGTTGTEVLGQIRDTLLRLDRSTTLVDGAILAEMRGLIAHVDRTLGFFRPSWYRVTVLEFLRAAWAAFRRPRHTIT